MKHLNDEERLAILEGQPSPEAAAHASQCAQCAAELAAARRSIQRLENFSWPIAAPVGSRQNILAAPLFKWAMAACVVLCAGFAFGRLSAPNAAQIQAAVKAQLSQELRRDLIAYVNEQAKTREAMPLESQRALLAVLADLRDQQTANYLSLRNDLETLASNADARLRRTSRLLELATAPATSSDPMQ